MKSLLRTILATSSTLFSATLLTQPASAQTGKPTITFDAKAAAGSVNPLLFGANHRWVEDASGSADPKTGLTYSKTVDQIKDVGITMIRYPAGLLGNLFQWERAIGPRAKRGMQISGLVITPVPFDSKFGPDEYGDLLERTGAAGNLLINFGTASAADAANFVAYMTAPQGSRPVNGIDWAARRAANGHRAPYKVAYAEIGNEYEPAVQKMIDQNYWILGEPVHINPACATDKISCLYAFGGSTRFTSQPVVQLTDWREPTSISSGAAGQTVYARYMPVAAASETVHVNGEAWKGRTTLAAATAGEQVYVIDYKSGAITFGDGKRGAIPPKGAKIAITYTSGPHEGFVDFYRAIKAANPDVKVCTSIHDESFMRIMGAQHAYDCIQQHPYYIGNPKNDTLSGGINDFFVFTAAKMIGLGAQVEHTQDLVKKHAGANAGKVDLLLSEYGQLGTFPEFSRHFARSHGQAVMNALAIREFILKQVAAADRTVLTDFVFKPIPPALAAVQSSDVAAAEEAMRNPENSTSGDFALFAGPGPETVVTPPALAMKLMRQNMGTTLLATSVAESPRVTSSKGDSLDALQTYATRDARGNIFLIVINVDPQRDILATVTPSNFVHGRSATVSTLASPNINDENNLSNPNKVAIQTRIADVAARSFEHTFPKYSVTAIKLSRR
jgi:alpha-L-arabinofuranosidase